MYMGEAFSEFVISCYKLIIKLSEGPQFLNHNLACERAHLRVTRASGEEQSDPAGRKESGISRLAASPLDFALACT